MEETKTSSLRGVVQKAFEKQYEKEESNKVSTKELLTSFIEDSSNLGSHQALPGLFFVEIIAKYVLRLKTPEKCLARRY